MPEKSPLLKISIFVVILLGLALFGYTNYRAATLSITHDEGVVYKLISANSFWTIFNYVIPQDHMINTWLMKLFCKFLPDNEYVVRMPNLLGHLFYIIFSILLLVRMKNPFVIIPGFVLLNFNPYLLDFFSVARGYGLSISLMMVSLYFAFMFIQSRKKRPLILAFFFGVLSVLTVYTLLNYFVALCSLVGIMMVFWLVENKFHQNRKAWATYGWYTLIILIGIAWVYLQLRGPLERIKPANFIYEEFKDNFYSGTLRPIAFRTIYNQASDLLVTIISFGVIISWAIAFLWMLIFMIRKNFNFITRLIFTSVIFLAIIALSLTVQNEWMGIRYLGNRTATFIIPLMILPLIGLSDEMTRIRFFKIPGILLVYFIAAFFFFNTLSHANFKYYLEWKFDSDTREMMNDLRKDIGPNPEKEVKFGIFWVHEPTINFYKQTWKLDWLKQVDRNGYMGDFNYFYVQEADSVLSKDIFKDKIKVKSYTNSGMILLKKAEL